MEVQEMKDARCEKVEEPETVVKMTIPITYEVPLRALEESHQAEGTELRAAIELRKAIGATKFKGISLPTAVSLMRLYRENRHKLLGE